ncbi:MAG: nucleotidyltransferase [Clostridia bacterium]|nr:nucleotidyltransferase [Clostridia bacterium]
MKPALVIMAAGMGSRYGGMKQIDPVDDFGHIIIDYSVFDAYRAGFRKVVFIIKEQNRADFEETIGRRIGNKMQVEYVYQQLEDIPEGFSVPEGRVKPWGTAHAILSARNAVKEPFAVINADDYYGITAFREIYNYLSSAQDDDKYRYCMVGYRLYNTLTENGSVGRGVCEVSPEGELISVTERTKIYKRGEGAAYTEDDGATFTELSPDATVSMNMWGFTPSLLPELAARFADTLRRGLAENPLKCEYFLPSAVSALLSEDKATVRVLSSPDRWYGVTYKEDKPTVVAALKSLRDAGLYPEKLLED